MNDPDDYYALLEAPPDATPAAIRRAYRQLAKRWHPDTNPQPRAAERMRQLVAAYETLADPDRRAAYDRSGSRRSTDGDDSGAPAPSLSDDRIIIDRIARGPRTVRVRVRNAGGPCTQITVDPERSGIVRVVGAALPKDGDGVAELEFIADRSSGASSEGFVPIDGAWVDAVFNVSLDGVSSLRVLSIR